MIKEDDITVSAAKASMIDILWPTVLPMIEGAVGFANDEIESEGLKKRLKASEMLLFIISKGTDILACLTLEQRDFPTGKSVMHISTAGGKDMNVWLEKSLVLLYELVRERDLDEIYIIGRPGWQKLLKSNGFELIHTVLRKKVN